MVRFGLSFLLALMLLSACGQSRTTSEDQVFSIWLYAEGIPPAEVDPLDPPALENDPLLTLSQIESYDPKTHEIRLTGEGYQIIHELTVPTDGKAFVVFANGEPVYTGAFWAPYSSQSFDGVVIDPYLATNEEPVIRIELGYPGAGFYTGVDPRSDKRILQSLEEAGKLKKEITRY